jgi:type II secretory pathway pseudopilin PulG
MRALIVIFLVLGSAAAIPAASSVFVRSTADPRAVLRQVERAQAEYRASHGRYTASLRALGMERPAGVDVRILAEGSAGYSAVVIGDAEECAVFHGEARAPRTWARTPGRIACRSR